MMYYTDASNGLSYFSCGENAAAGLLDSLPADSDTPLPHNALLEDLADGSQHKGMMDWPSPDPDYRPKAKPQTSQRFQQQPYYSPTYNRRTYFGSRQSPFGDYHNNPYEYSDYDDDILDNDKNFIYEVLTQRSRNRHPSRLDDVDGEDDKTGDYGYNYGYQAQPELARYPATEPRKQIIHAKESPSQKQITKTEAKVAVPEEKVVSGANKEIGGGFSVSGSESVFSGFILWCPFFPVLYIRLDLFKLFLFCSSPLCYFYLSILSSFLCILVFGFL